MKNENILVLLIGPNEDGAKAQDLLMLTPIVLPDPLQVPCLLEVKQKIVGLENIKKFIKEKRKVQKEEEEKEFNRMIEVIKYDLLLKDGEFSRITKPDTPGFKRRARRLERVRIEMRKIVIQGGLDLSDFLFVVNKDLGMSYYQGLVRGNFKAVLEDLAKVNQMFSAFQKDFQLKHIQVRHIVKVNLSSYKDRLRKMDELRKIIVESLPKEARRDWLFAHNRILKDVAFNAMVNGNFDAVIEAARKLRK